MENDWCHFIFTWKGHDKIAWAPCSFKKYLEWHTQIPNRLLIGHHRLRLITGNTRVFFREALAQLGTKRLGPNRSPPPTRYTLQTHTGQSQDTLPNDHPISLEMRKLIGLVFFFYSKKPHHACKEVDGPPIIIGSHFARERACCHQNLKMMLPM